MSFYDDSTLMFLAAGAAGVDGKADTIKPAYPNGRAPLYVTRGSNLTATRVDSNGLIEKGRENLLKDSNSFDPSGTAWNPTTAFTLTSGQEGYDSSNDAWLLNKTTTGNDYFQQRSINGMSGNVITESIYAKAGTEVGLMLYNSNGYAHWNLSSGTLISEGGNPITSSIESIGNGWYRCSVTVDGDNSYDRMMIKVVNSNAANSSGSIYIQDAQIELGLVATEYVESGSTTGKAGLLENEPRFNYPIGGGSPHLLLEPSRTNLVGFTEYFEGTNWGVGGSTGLQLRTSITSPDGNNGVYLVTSEAENTSSRVQYNLGVLGNDHIFSVFIKGTGSATRIRLRNNTAGLNSVVYDIDSSGNFTLNTESAHDGYYGVDDYGNGWHRVYLKVETSGASNNFMQIFSDIVDADGSIYVWGAQAEEDSYITSYIPNHSGGSVSRESEEVQTADVSSLINQNEGTFFLDFEFLDGQTAENQNWIALESEDGQSRVLFYKSAATNNLRLLTTADNSVVFAKSSLIAISPNTRYKVAVRYSSGDQGVAINGSMSGNDGTATYTRTSLLSRVKFNESNVQPTCRVHQCIVFESGYSNADLEKLTSGI